MTRRALERAQRRLADQTSEQIADVPAARLFRATVVAVIPSGAADGNPLVTVRWRDAEFPATYGDHYSPAVGHRVLCALVDNQPEILHHSIGYT